MTSSTPDSVDRRARRLSTKTFWSSDWSLTVLLLLLVANIFSLPITLSNSWGRLISRAILSFIIISGIVATVRRRSLIVLTGLFTAGILFIGWEEVVHPSHRLQLLNDLAALPAIMLLLVLIIRQVFRAGPITMRRVRGAIAVYLLVGLMWALTYDLVDIVYPGSFRGGLSSGTDLGDLGYFSFTTLTSLGLGDIIPVSPLARSLTVMEALVGQLFPAILIARLVGMELSYRQSRNEIPRDPG